MKNTKLTIDRIEEDFAVAKGESGVMVNLSLALLPDGTTEGDVMNIIINKDSEKTEEEKQNAKDILNEILSNSS